MIDSFTGKYSFLSNFYPVDILYGGFVYPSTEHAYQAAKTNDIEIRRGFTTNNPRILTAGQAKRLGRTIPVRDDWETIKVKVMMDVIDIKFNIAPLKELLIHTGTETLIEGNTWGDTFWGVCNGVGKNMLGKILMEKRNLLNVEKFYTR